MNNKALIIGLAAIAVIGVAVLTMSSKKPTPAMTQNPAPTAMATAAPTAMPSTGEAMTNTTGEATGDYKAGKYTAEGDYTSPAGPEKVKVDLSLSADGTITDIMFTGETEHPMSKKFQGKFSSGYKTLVMGKKIDDVKLDKVSGSSLTPMGFNDAIEKIKADAKG
jgi:uncharacterized protein with FMN-binding domain